MSPLQRQVVDISFGGLDTKTAAQLVQPGKSLVLQDAEFDRLVALNKRNGYSALATTSNVASGASTVGSCQGIVKHGTTPLITDGKKLYRRSTVGAATVWEQLGKSTDTQFLPGAVLQSQEALSASGTSCLYCDMAVLNGIGLVVYRGDAGNSLFYSLVNVSTWEVIDSGFLANSNTGLVRAVASATRLMAVFSSAAYTISVAAWDPAALTYTAPAATAIVADWGNLVDDGGFDVGYNAATGCVLAYPQSTTYNPILQKFDESGAVGGPTAIAETAVGPISLVMCASGKIALCISRGASEASLHLRATDLSLIQSGDAGVAGNHVYSVAAIGVEYATDSVRWFIPKRDTTTWTGTTRYITRQATITSSTITDETTVAGTLYGFTPVSRPFTYQGLAVAWFGYFSVQPTTNADLQPTYALMTLGAPTASYPGRLVATSLESNALPSATHDTVASFFMPSTPYGTAVVLPAQKLGANTGVVPTLVRLDAAAPMRAATIDGTSVVTGLQAYETDGFSLHEAGFKFVPEIRVTSTAATGSLAAGDYFLCAIFTSTDGNGNITRSGVSNVVKATVAASGNVHVGVWGYFSSTRVGEQASYFRPGYSIEVYISADGISYYLGKISAPTFTGETSINVTALDTSAQQLYTNGSGVPNSPLPCLVDVLSRNRRLYGVTPEGEVLYTLEKTVGESPAWPTDFATKRLIDDPGQHWRLSDMDGRLVALGEHTMQWMGGDGINATGTSDDLSRPQLLPTEGGIIRYSPVLAIEDGIWVKMLQGLHVLNRSLAIDSLGLPVDSYQNNTVVSIINVQHRHQVRVGHSDTSTLCFDLIAKAWSSFTNHTQVGAVYIDGTTYVALASGVVLASSDSLWTDNGTAIGRVIETPWLRIGALEGVQRLYFVNLLGEYRSAISLQMTCYYDFALTGDPPVTFAKTTGTSGERLHFRHHSGRRCQAVKFRIVDTSAGEGASLSGLSLELGAVPQVTRHGPTV